jgi:hypothetical protein
MPLLCFITKHLFYMPPILVVATNHTEAFATDFDRTSWTGNHTIVRRLLNSGQHNAEHSGYIAHREEK